MTSSEELSNKRETRQVDINQNRIGILEDVGASYILLRSFENDSLVYCDIYSIKFITISTTGIYGSRPNNTYPYY